MAFTIAGRDRGRFVSVTRTQPAGAGVLADKWVRRGFTDVQIEWNGRSYDVASFRSLFVLTRNGIKLRSTITP